MRTSRAIVAGLAAIFAASVAQAQEAVRGIWTNSTAGGTLGSLAMGAADPDAPTARDEAKPVDYSRNGFYVGLGGTYAFPEFHRVRSCPDEPDVCALNGQSFDDSLGINGRIGYRVAPAVAFEAEVEWIDSFDGNTAKAENLVLTTLNAKVPFPIGRFQPFGIVGIGVMFWDKKENGSSDSSSEGSMRLGGGLDVYATEHIVLSIDAEYVFLFDDRDKIEYVSVGWGLEYRF